MVSSVTLSAIVPALGYLRVCVCVEVHFLADITVCVTSALVHTIKSLVLCVRVLKAEEIYTTTDDKRQESGIPFFPATLSYPCVAKKKTFWSGFSRVSLCCVSKANLKHHLLHNDRSAFRTVTLLQDRPVSRHHTIRIDRLSDPSTV